MQKTQFIKHEAERLGVNEERFLRYHNVVECRCPYPHKTNCPGWRAVYKVTGRGRGEA